MTMTMLKVITVIRIIIITVTIPMTMVMGMTMIIMNIIIIIIPIKAFQLMMKAKLYKGKKRTFKTIMPSLSARLHHTCSVSVATAFCLSLFRAKTVRMLCSLSASLITSTSGSETMLTMNVLSCSSSSLPSPMPRLLPDCSQEELFGNQKVSSCVRKRGIPQIQIEVPVESRSSFLRAFLSVLGRCGKSCKLWFDPPPSQGSWLKKQTSTLSQRSSAHTHTRSYAGTVWVYAHGVQEERPKHRQLPFASLTLRCESMAVNGEIRNTHSPCCQLGSMQKNLSSTTGLTSCLLRRLSS